MLKDVGQGACDTIGAFVTQTLEAVLFLAVPLWGLPLWSKGDLGAVQATGRLSNLTRVGSPF